MDINGKHIVVDLETLSTKSNAAIVSIGAVLIDKLEIVDTFYCNVAVSYTHLTLPTICSV